MFLITVTDDHVSASQERFPAKAAAGPDSIGAARNSQLAAGAAEPGNPTSTSGSASGSASTSSTISTSPPSSLLPGVGEQRSHAGQHLQLRPAQAVHCCSEPRWNGLRHPVLWFLRVEPVLPAVTSHLAQAVQQGHYAPLHQGQQRGVPELSFFPTSTSTLPQLQ